MRVDPYETHSYEMHMGIVQPNTGFRVLPVVPVVTCLSACAGETWHRPTI